MQPCGGMGYATMCRSGVCNHEEELRMQPREGVSVVCSHVQEWRIQPSEGVEYAVMCRSGVSNYVKIMEEAFM